MLRAEAVSCFKSKDLLLLSNSYRSKWFLCSWVLVQEKHVALNKRNYLKMLNNSARSWNMKSILISNTGEWLGCYRQSFVASSSLPRDEMCADGANQQLWYTFNTTKYCSSLLKFTQWFCTHKMPSHILFIHFSSNTAKTQSLINNIQVYLDDVLTAG